MKHKSLNKRWSVSERTQSNIIFYIAWTTKYARDVIDCDIENIIKKTINKICCENEWALLNLVINKNYVQLTIKCGVIESASYIVAQIKSATSHEIRKEFPHIWSRLPNLWTRSFFASTVGCVDLDKIKSYVESQKWSNKKT